MGDPRSRRWLVPLAFGATAVLVLVAALPGLLGSWVGDDFHMVSSRLYGDWAEIPRTFMRHAGHYLGKAQDADAAFPYRPITMVTLLVSHALVPQPWLHHLISWAMHIATGGLLLVALLRQTPPQRHSSARPVCLVLTALFLLHPATVETYVFINGRSDLVGGLCLAALGTVLLKPSLPRVTRLLLVALIAFLGAGSKSTFIPAALTLWLGLALRSERRREDLRLGLPLAAGLAAFFVVRVMNVPLSARRFGASEDIVGDFALFSDLLHLLAKSAAAVLTFQAEVMQSLAWELFQPFSPIEWVGAAVLVVASVALSVRKDFGGLVLLCGFALTVAPCVIVSRSIWLGFDRYLYMPMILGLVAAAPYVVAAVEAWPKGRMMWWGVAATLILIAALGTRASSLAYVNQTAYERALVADHPDDPSIIFYLARTAQNSGNPELARQTLSRIQQPPWPVAIVVPVVVVSAELGEERIRDIAIEYGIRSDLENSTLRAYAMRWNYERGHVTEALAFARSIGSDDTVCPEVRRQLEVWARSANSELDRAQMYETAVGLRCSAR